MFERLVVGYAGDRAGRDAVALATAIARATGAELTIVFPYHPLLSPVPASVAEERVRGELRSMLGDRYPVQARYHWSTASWPIRALQELASHESADLIVFGAAQERLERRHLSLMERVVHGAPCAVVVAPAGYANAGDAAMLRVGVGFADSPEGHAAIALARELADHVQGELRIIAGSGLSPALARYAFSSPSLPTVEEEMCTQIEANLRRVSSEILGARLDAGGVELEVHRGDPSRVLADASRSLDLLVLGSRAYGPLRHTLLGSVSADVMRSARCPVMVLPRGSGQGRERTLDTTTAGAQA